MTPGPDLRLLDDAARRRLHDASLHVLERTGLLVKHEGARKLYAEAGARVDDAIVRVPPAMVEQALATAPRRWGLRRRGAEGPPLLLEQGHTYFGTGPDCPFVHDVRTGERRRARLADVAEAARLAEMLPNIDYVMSMGLPDDVRSERLEQAQFAAMAGATSKPIILSSPFGEESLREVVEMAELCGGRRSVGCLVMSSPPLMLDAAMAEKITACAELEVPLVMAPSSTAGTAAPATVAAAITVANAEVLAALVLHQIARPGAPFIYGAGASAFDMRASVDAYGSPEVFAGNQASCELAAGYGLPSWSYAGHSDSSALDEQWSLDSAVATLYGALSRATLLHDVGYLESGRASSLAALVLGDELCGFARAFAAAVDVSDETLLLDEIDAVGPGGTHLGRKETRRRYRGFWSAALLEHSPHDRWVTDGSATLGERTRQRTLELLAREPSFTPQPATARMLEEVIASATI